jgi:hypothetical protein
MESSSDHSVPVFRMRRDPSPWEYLRIGLRGYTSLPPRYQRNRVEVERFAVAVETGLDGDVDGVAVDVAAAEVLIVDDRAGGVGGDGGGKTGGVVGVAPFVAAGPSTGDDGFNALGLFAGIGQLRRAGRVAGDLLVAEDLDLVDDFQSRHGADGFVVGVGFVGDALIGKRGGPRDSQQRDFHVPLLSDRIERRECCGLGGLDQAEAESGEGEALKQLRAARHFFLPRFQIEPARGEAVALFAGGRKSGTPVCLVSSDYPDD